MVPFFLPLAPNPASTLLDSAAAAHASLSHFRVHVELNAVTAQGRVATTFDLAENGQTFLLRIREPRRRGMDRSDRTFLFGPTKVVGYDAVANEQLSEATAKGASRIARLEATLGAASDVVKALLDPATMKAFLGSAKSGHWKIVPHGSETWLTQTVPGTSNQELISLDRKTHLLRRVDAYGRGSAVHWTLAYSTPGPVAFAPPSGARRVSSFTVAPEPPVFLSKQAEQVTHRLWGAYYRYPSGTIQVEGSNGKTKISINGRRIREDQANVSYAYDGKVLTILDRQHHRFYRGETVRVAIADMLSGIGQSCDNLSRQLTSGRIPYRGAFSVSSRVSVEGQVESVSGPCDILSVNNGSVRTTIFVRRRDGLVDSIMTTINGAMSSNRRYKYTPLGSVSFKLSPKPGQAVLPLPKVKISPGELPGQSMPMQG